MRSTRAPTSTRSASEPRRSAQREQQPRASARDAFDFDAAVQAPFRMQPGLRRLADGSRSSTRCTRQPAPAREVAGTRRPSLRPCSARPATTRCRGCGTGHAGGHRTPGGLRLGRQHRRAVAWLVRARRGTAAHRPRSRANARASRACLAHAARLAPGRAAGAGLCRGLCADRRAHRPDSLADRRPALALGAGTHGGAAFCAGARAGGRQPGAAGGRRRAGAAGQLRRARSSVSSGPSRQGTR